MPTYDTQIIRCRRCGNAFTWTAGEQHYYHERGLEKPKDCADCRPIRRDYFRSSQIDHPTATPPPPLPPQEPDAPPAPPFIPSPMIPDVEQRPSWWANPINRNTAALALLGLLALVVFILLLVVIF